jgi:hypothetical protein
VLGFSVLFLVFFAITSSLTLVQLDKKGYEVFVWATAISYALGAFCIAVALWRHWHSSTAVS